MQDLIFSILKEITGEDLSGEGDVNLFDSGRVDSLGIIELIIALEEKINVNLDPAVVERKDIETPNKIIKYIEGIIER